jgi:glutathione synthase/RimK-type ligase-like ATP-grasp enzyme
MRLAIVANALSPTNRRLVLAARAAGLDTVFLPPRVAERTLGAGDVALGRIDVLPTLDGPEPGLQSLRALEERDVLVLNRAGALFAVHDKLTTALRLAAFGLPHPRTVYVGGAQDGFAFPVVVKPRFGSWGNEVTLCRDGDALARCFRRIRREVVGAVQRVAAPREWRTNVALGASRATVVPPPRACELALRAASAFGIDSRVSTCSPTDAAGGSFSS